MADGSATLVDRIVDLGTRSWPSLGSLDDEALIVATENALVSGFALWKLDPSAWRFVETSTGSGDYEIEILSGKSAEHDIGVLNISDDPRYVVALDSSIANADLTIELLIDGMVVATLPAAYDPGDGTFGGAVFELSTIDLSAFTVGTSRVSLRFTNNETDAVRLDNFAVTGAAFDEIEEIGSEAFSTTGLSGDISAGVQSVQVTGAGDQTAAVQSGVSFNVHDIDAAAGEFAWNFEAPTSLFAFVPAGETIVLEFTVRLSGATSGSVDETVTVAITGVNEAPVGDALNFSGTEDTPISGQLTAFDIDGDALTFGLFDRPANGDVIVSSDGTFTYTPDPDYNGADDFTYEVTDPSGATALGSAALSISAVNDAPENRGTNVDQAYKIRVDGQTNFFLTGLILKDVDATGDLTVNFDTGGNGSLSFGTTALSGIDVGATSLTGTVGELNTYFANGDDVIYTDTSGAETTIVISVNDGGSTGSGGVQTTSLGAVAISVDAPPVAGDLSLNGTEDSIVVGTLPGTDAGGDPLIFALASGGAPANGTVKIALDGGFIYTPFSNFAGTDSFTYTVTDGGATDTGVVTIELAEEGDLPILIDEIETVAEDGGLAGRLRGFSIGGGELSYSLAPGGEPSKGTVSISADGRYVYTPFADENGSDFFTFVASDGASSRTATASITITAVQDAPVALSASNAGDEDQAISGQLEASDVDGEALTFSVAEGGAPNHGTVTVSEAGGYVYTPFEDFFGEDAFVFAVTDGIDTVTADVSLTVNPVNDDPVIQDDALTVEEDGAVTASILASDRDFDPLSFGIATPPSSGTVVLNDDGIYTYTPFANVNGADSFELSVSDGTVIRTALINVEITSVNDAPFAVDDVGSTKEDVAIVLALAANDTDIDAGDVLRVVAVGTAAHGTAEVTAEGAVLYTPDADFFGTDSFSYTVGDGNGGTAEGQATVSIAAQGEIPVIGTDGDDVFEVRHSTGRDRAFDGGAGFDVVRNTRHKKDFDLTDASFDGVEAIDGNGGDIEVARDGRLDLSNIATLIDVGRIEGSSGNEIIIGSQDDDNIVGRGGADLIFGGLGNDILEGGSGLDTLFGGIGDDVFVVSGDHGGDGDGDDDAPTVAGELFDGGAGFDIVRNARRGKDFDLSGASFVGIEAIDGNSGAIRVARDTTLDLSSIETLIDVDGIEGSSGNEIITGSQDDDSIDGRGGFDRVVVNGPVTDFSFEVTGLKAAVISGPGIGTDVLRRVEAVRFDDYTLFLDGRNNAPIGFTDRVTTDEDTVLTLAAAGLLANDIDPEGDSILITGVSSGAIAVTLGATGEITIDPTGAFDALALGETAVLEASYAIADTAGAAGSGLIEITVTGVNDGPEAGDDEAVTAEQMPVSGNVLANDTDIDNGAMLTVKAVNDTAAVGGVIALASGASVAMQANGDFTYDPGDNFATVALGDTATDGFTYTVTDENGAEDTATVTLTINGDNEVPLDGDETYGVEASFAFEVDAAGGLLANAFDVDVGDALSIFGVDGITLIPGDNGGTFLINPDGSFGFDTGVDFNGLQLGDTATTALTYEVTDGNGGFATSTVEIIVTGSDFDPFTEDEDRFDQFDQADFDALRPISVTGTFEQLGGVDAATELFSRLVGTDVNLETIFDITFIDIDKTISFTSLPGEDFTFMIVDNITPTGTLPGFNNAIDGAFTAFAAVAGTVIPLDAGPVQLQPTFDLDIELDINFGIDVDLPTLGKAAFFQPIRLDLFAPTEVAANDAFILTSGNLQSLTPRTVIETIGLGSVDIETEFSIGDTSISDLGYAIESSDFGPFKLDGLASKSTTFNAELNLGEVIEQTKKFIAGVVEDIEGVFGDQLPFEPSEILDTLFSLDLGNIATNILSGQVEFSDLIEIINAGDPAEVLKAINDLVKRLSKEPEEEPLIDVNGGAVTAQELYELSQRALFNEFDRFDDDNVGLFTLPVVDENGEETGETVEVTTAQIAEKLELLGIPQRIQQAVNAISSFNFAPFDGLDVNFALPIGNLEQIEGFGTNATGDLIMGPLDGEQTIEVRQETKLIDVAIDFEKTAIGLVDSLLAAAADVSPQAAALRTYLAFATQVKDAAEEGVEIDLSLNPAQLVQASVNGVVGALNAAGRAIDFLVPGDIFTEIPEISESATLATIDAFIDTTVGAISNVFAAVESLVAGVADFLGTILTGVAGGLDGIASILGVATGLVGSAIDSAISALESVRNFGFTIPNPLPFCDDLDVRPFAAIVSVPIALLNGLKTAVDAAQTGVDNIASFTDQIRDVAADLQAFDIDGVISEPINDFGAFLKDLARGASIGAELGVDILEATIDASLSVVQIATFDPNEVTVDYSVGGFEIGRGLDEAVGMFALGEAGDTLQGSAEYGFSGNVDYEYRLKLDLDPNFKFLESIIIGELLVGENISEQFEEDFTLIAITDEEAGQTNPEAENALLDFRFNFTEAVTGAVEDAFEQLLGISAPPDVVLEEGELFLFAVEDVVLDADRFLPVTQDFTLDLVGTETLSGIETLRFDDQDIPPPGLTIIGTTGPDVLTGTAGNDTLRGGASDDILDAGDGIDQLNGGTGDDILSGGLGDDTFLFRTGDGNDTVQDFTAGLGSEDVLDVGGLGYLDLASVLADTVQNGADAVITSEPLGGDSITLVGVDKAALHQDDFIFA